MRLTAGPVVACMLLAACAPTSSIAPPEVYTPAPLAPNARVTAGGELVAYLAASATWARSHSRPRRNASAKPRAPRALTSRR
jgi:hypothetical protein